MSGPRAHAPRDTIAALATPGGSGGVGVVRVSGPAAVAVLARLTRLDAAGLADGRVRLCVVHDPASGARLDEALVFARRGPRSFTGEDVAEVQGHGGALNMARLLAATLAAGARAAEPGEFTRRAFENGRLDLARAEAVAAVIGAASERALRVAQAQLGGALGARVEALRGEIAALLAEVEAAIDFPDEGLAFAGGAVLCARAEVVGDEIAALAASFATGRALREGLVVALVGAPNVGKSSLLNALAGEERALVAAEPGTTRDWVEARVVWDGVPVTLVDTAGEREVSGDVERRGIELGRRRAAQADVVLRVVSVVEGGAAGGAGGAGAGDAAVGAGDAAGARELVVWNKIDLGTAPGEALGVSALTGAGLDALRAAALGVALGEGAGAGAGARDDEGVVVSSERQRAALGEAAAALRAGVVAWRAGRPVELVAADLRAASAALARVHGADVRDDVLDALFGRFCIGK